MNIRIIIGDITLNGTLLDNETAKEVYEALPIESNINTWGDEIYFSIPVDRELENGTMDVDVGDVAYWPSGKAFCIFYGRTPASGGDDKPVPASDVTPLGKVTDDATVLKNVTSGKIRIEAA